MPDIKQYLTKLKPTLGGRLLYLCVPYRRKLVFSNIQRVFGEQLSLSEMKKLALCFYSHLARSLRENIAMRFSSMRHLKSKAEIIGAEHVLAAAEANKGVLLLSGHFGNWELAPIAGILNFTQYQHRFHFIRKTLGSKWIEKILFNRFFRAGLNVIPKRNSLAQVCDKLDNNDVVVFIMDQHASINSKDGIMADFFGEPAATYRSLAMIACHTGAPVVPALSYRKANGQHVLEFKPALEWLAHDNAKQEIYLNTRHYNQVLEAMVLAHPEQWLWLHRRWKGAK